MQGKGSVVMFCGVDKAYYQGALNWVPLIQAGDWPVHMDRSFSGAIPIIDKLKNEGAISEPVFAFYLTKIAPITSLYGDNWEGCLVMFGGVDHRCYEGELNWVPLIQAGNWIVHMDCISMKREVIACSDGCEAFVDTGTSHIVGPRRLVNNIQKLIGATHWRSKHYVSCSVVNTLPSIIFTINGINYPVSSSLHPQGEGTIPSDSRGRCYTTFQEHRMSSSTETWILGDIFLRVYFSVFDRGNDRIGLVRAV
ncbi:hypothetical protein MG293_019841 [Ovis ammon polii]|uniref:Peptidase A1 domain-containing protein n=1 Tax=Ovis ammon polii TaxID=230172 RepID=A0AAD4TQY1_OVIAM|nr:hypothetical protein MG293_019841 [Ovis ammon polii]